MKQAFSLFTGLLLLAPLDSTAQSGTTRTWDRDAGNNGWHVATNWTGDTVPTAADIAAFDGGTAPTLTMSVNAPATVFEIQFTGTEIHSIQSGANAAQTLSVVGNIVNNATAQQVFGHNAGTGNSLNLELLPGDHIFEAAGSVIRVHTGITGSGANLIKEGSQSLTFASWTGTNPAGAPNTYDGMTTIRQGALVLDKNDGVNAVAGDITIGDGTGNDILVLRESNQIADDSKLGFDGRLAIFRLAGHDETVGGIQSLALDSGLIENTSDTSPSTLTIDSNDNESFNGLIKDAGDASLAIFKKGSGTLSILDANTYTGDTTIDEGTLRVVNSSGSATGTGILRIRAGATLVGDGVIGGPVEVKSGGTLTPGDSIGTLTVNNSFNLGVTATTIMEISRENGVLSNDLVTGVSLFIVRGTLIIEDVGNELLASGDSFQLFSAVNITHSFSSVILPPLWPGLSWDVSDLMNGGSISVTGTALPPKMDDFRILAPGDPGNPGPDPLIMLEGSGGSPDFAFTVFSSTDLVVWTPESTDLFDALGEVNLSLPFNPSEPRKYFIFEGHPAP